MVFSRCDQLTEDCELTGDCELTELTEDWSRVRYYLQSCSFSDYTPGIVMTWLPFHTALSNQWYCSAQQNRPVTTPSVPQFQVMFMSSSMNCNNN